MKIFAYNWDMPAPDRVKQLIETFEQNIAAYRSQKNETELRRQFLDPFFEALGWDVDNKNGYDERKKEMAHEFSVEIDGAQKKADYAFRTGRDSFDFLVEAKKPSVKIESNLDAAFQIRRYGWSAGLPINILTDFEHFAIYDCRTRPNYSKDKVGTGLLQLIHYKEYLERWDEIAGLFSPDAIRKGALDSFKDQLKGKKGTQEVDDAFLEEIEGWRETLARNIATRNKHLNLNEEQINFAVQMTIDRIIFLRIAEERGMEKDRRLFELTEGDPLPASPKSAGEKTHKPKSSADLEEVSRSDGGSRRGSIYSNLLILFQQADARYNSGLFHFKKDKDRENPDTLTPELEIDDKVLKDIIKDLYYPSPYAFNYIPTEILGSVYERFLGKVIRLTADRNAKVDEKPEVRKAGGVYYTPAYIVDYIVKNTVGKLLSPLPAGEGRVMDDFDFALTPNPSPGGRGGLDPDDVSKIKIVDPACGSGSFLLGAYQFLLDWHLDWYVNHDLEKSLKKKILLTADNKTYRLSLDEKKRILLNNIHGVDIDPQAVEVTKLSLLLKVVEDPGQLQLFEEGHILPNLNRNIKNGNALIGMDYFSGQMFGDMEEMKRVKPFEWKDEFPEVFRRGGFDVVIGNPPYGAYLYESDKSFLLANYVCQNYQLDTYLLFLENSIKTLLRERGFFGMIVPNPWMTNLLQTSTRKFVVENTLVNEIVHFKFPVFRKVTVDAQIVILQKGKSEKWTPVAMIVEQQNDLISGTNLQRIEHKQDYWQSLDGGIINIFMSQTEHDLAARIKGVSVELQSLFDINVGIKPYQTGKGKPPQPKQVVENRPFDSDKKSDASFRPYLRGSDINRYTINPLKSRYIKYGGWLAEPRPAANFDAPEKVVMRQTGDSIVAALDLKQYLCLNNMHVIVPKKIQYSIKYVLGSLNSSMVNWYYHSLNPEVGEALAEVKKTNVAKLPIRAINFDDPAEKAMHDKMVSLVEQMPDLTGLNRPVRSGTEVELLERQIKSTDRQIDELVYQLYGLTPDEIKIVEGN